jgi:hypothetical protein
MLRHSRSPTIVLLGAAGAKSSDSRALGTRATLLESGAQFVSRRTSLGSLADAQEIPKPAIGMELTLASNPALLYSAS